MLNSQQATRSCHSNSWDNDDIIAWRVRETSFMNLGINYCDQSVNVGDGDLPCGVKGNVKRKF